MQTSKPQYPWSAYGARLLPMEEDTLGVVLVIPGSAACRVGRPWGLPDVKLVIFVLAQAYRPQCDGIFALHTLASSPQT